MDMLGTWGVSSYISNDLDVDVLGLDHWVGRRLVEAKRVVVVVELSPFGLLGLVLGHGTRALSLLANRSAVERRDVVSIADLRP